MVEETEIDINVEDRHGVTALAYAYFGVYLYLGDYVETVKTLRSVDRIITK